MKIIGFMGTTKKLALNPAVEGRQEMGVPAETIICTKVNIYDNYGG